MLNRLLSRQTLLLVTQWGLFLSLCLTLLLQFGIFVLCLWFPREYSEYGILVAGLSVPLAVLAIAEFVVFWLSPGKGVTGGLRGAMVIVTVMILLGEGALMFLLLVASPFVWDAVEQGRNQV